jgi:hypothetical protein
VSRKIIVGGEEKGDWFDAVLSWASPARGKPTTAPAPATTRKSREEVVEAARSIQTREQLMPVSEPSEPHTVVPEPPLPEPPLPEPPLKSRHHPCGHLSWASPEQDEAARAEGKCCGNWRQPPNWEVRGLHTPLPENQRRTLARERGGGWPGLCYDPETGLYIGGVVNDCRRQEGEVRCAVHAAPVPALTATEEGEGEEGGKRAASRSPRKKERPT